MDLTEPWVCIPVLAGFVFAALLIQSSVRQQEARMIATLGRTLSGIANHAHRLKDDLALQATVQAAAQTPAVIAAAITDRSEIILAHSDPSRLGQILGPLRRGASVINFPLEDEGRRWGTLYLRMSNRSERRQTTRAMSLIMVLGGVLTLAVYLLQTHWKRLLMDSARQLRQSQSLCELKDHEAETLERQHCESERVLKDVIQRIVEHLKGPRLILDAHQRVLALNHAAKVRIRMEEDAAVGASCHEIPGLAECAGALELSLTQPGVNVQAVAHGAPVAFLTVPAERSDTTWITWLDEP